jgi:hypothetical protein
MKGVYFLYLLLRKANGWLGAISFVLLIDRPSCSTQQLALVVGRFITYPLAARLPANPLHAVLARALLPKTISSFVFLMSLPCC